MLLSDSCGVKEDKSTAVAVPDTNDSAICVRTRIGLSEPAHHQPSQVLEEFRYRISGRTKPSVSERFLRSNFVEERLKIAQIGTAVTVDIERR